MKKLILVFACVCTTLSAFSQTIYSNNFTGGSSGWTLGMGGNFDTWIVNSVYNCSDPTPNNGGGNYLHIYDDLFGEMCSFSGFYGSGSGGTVYATMSSDISTSGYTSVNVSFDWLCQGQTGPILPSYGFIEYSTNGGVGWNLITSPITQYNGQSSWTTMNFNSTAMANQFTLRIRFGFQNSGYGYNPAFGIDNLTISGGSCTNLGGIANASPSSICSGNTSLVTVVASIGTIQWQQSPDGIGSWIDVIGGSGATTANYTTATLSSTTYYRAKLSQPTCPDVFSTVTSVTVNPSVAASVSIAANPSNIICDNTNVLFTATPTNGGTPTYQWFLNGGPVGSGSTYSNANLNSGDQVYCMMTSTAPCVSGSPATSNTITMTVNPNPVATITPPGPITYCSDTSVFLFCGTPGSYDWSDGSTASGTTPVISGNYCVIVTDANGCSDTACVLVTINPVPNVTITGNDTICEGDQTILTANGANTYVWSTTQTINPITVSPAGNITYTVTGTESVNMCTATATMDIVVSTNTIDNSTSSLSPVTLHANQNGATYQWIDCNNGNAPLSGETGQDFTASVNGDYAVVINQGPCADTSACFNINSVGIEENNITPISVYPNPSGGTFTIASPVAGSYSIVNELGQTVLSVQLSTANNFTMQVEGLSTGVYFLTGKTENGMMRQKIIVK